MIAHVADRALESGAKRVVVATDDDRIASAIEGSGALACLTRTSHPSGTDRIAEAVEQLRLGDDEIVVNVQGDEPLMPPSLIQQVAAALAGNSSADMATACHPAGDGDAENPDVVKVVRDDKGFALYFSRAPIPFVRSAAGGEGVHLRHVGIYAYRAGFIRRFTAWPSCWLERLESLEQLRALWHGGRVLVVDAKEVAPMAVDTAEDLAKVRAVLDPVDGG
jgi:3-deoxy-manno-octulosonate cytidylyltransferase (CMP-KDO synthetase)